MCLGNDEYYEVKCTGLVTRKMHAFLSNVRVGRPVPTF